MGKKLYVGNLPFSASVEELQNTFEQYGEVESARIITDRDTGRSKGFGFIEMLNDDAASEAIDRLNGSDFGGRNMVVNEARPKAPRDNHRGGGRGFGGGRGPRY